MTTADEKREEIRAAWIKHVAPGRRAKNAPIAPVGFNYAKAIEDVKDRKPNGFTLEQIAECMGVSPEMVDKYRKGTIPDHLGGESLWGLYECVFGKGSSRRDLISTEHLLEWDEKELLTKKKR